ncbi:MAG: hypothetical protein AAF334_10335 [Pseudomonadota bacterium]
MNKTMFAAGGLVAAVLLLAACQQDGTNVAELVTPEIGYPQAGEEIIAPPADFDVTAFEAFIATAPSPELFETQYPDIQLVMPMTPTTLEYRPDYSRFFAELDEDNRIIGGYFQ